MGRVELRHLRYYVAVAEALNFTRAAALLRVAQPSLSRQVRQLEDEIGVVLLERSQRGVRLTPAGTEFLAEARSILSRSDDAVRAIRALEDGTRGPLNLGYVWGLFHGMVPGAMERFHRLAPEAAVNLFDWTAAQQATGLAEGRLDAGFIGFGEEAEVWGLARRKVGECAWVAALPAGHPSARRRVLPIRALAGGVFLTISESAFPGAARLVAKACAEAGFRPRLVQAADRGHTLLTLVAGNCGVGLVPESLAALPHPGVVLKRLEQPPRGDLYLAWNPARKSALRDLFLGTCKEPAPGAPTRCGPS